MQREGDGPEERIERGLAVRATEDEDLVRRGKRA